MGAKLLQTAAHHHREVRFAVLVADIDRFFDAVVLQRLGNTRRKLARLFLGGRVGQIALNHDRDRVDRHDEQHENDGDSDGTHALDHRGQAEVIGGRFRAGCRVLQQQHKTQELGSKNTH
jgi:hypothetical protein